MRFSYNRELVSEIAIGQAYNNAILAGQRGTYRRTTNRLSNMLPFAEFTYALDLGATGVTGSALFMSEMLWMAGLPMTQLDTNECQSGVLDWRFCPSRVQSIQLRGNSSPAWREHGNIIEYYTSGVDVPFPRSGDSNTSLDGLNASALGTFIPPVTNVANDPATLSRTIFLAPIDNPTLPIVNEDGFLTGGTGGTFDFVAVSQLVREVLASNADSKLTVRQGDYMWINSQESAGGTADAHGLLVVGWQAAITCTDALTRNFSIDQFYTTGAGTPEGESVVPYVVDFNRLQRTSPRPFYCTAATDAAGLAPENYFGGDHSWYFYTMPDTIQVEADNVSGISLYVSPFWQWED